MSFVLIFCRWVGRCCHAHKTLVLVSQHYDSETGAEEKIRICGVRHGAGHVPVRRKNFFCVLAHFYIELGRSKTPTCETHAPTVLLIWITSVPLSRPSHEQLRD